MLERYLEDLETRIDPAVEEGLIDSWKIFCDHGTGSGIFTPRRPEKRPPRTVWPEICINDALEDFEKMALEQFGMCSQLLARGRGGLMNIRCNYGTGILASLFGPDLYIMPRETNTLPTTRPLPNGIRDIRACLDRGVPDIRSGLGARTFETAERYRELMPRYPRISEYVHVIHPDLQGPMDICELLWGSSLFIDIMDHPDLVRSFLGVITETYIRFLDEWLECFPRKGAYSVHWNKLHKGTVMLRDDSAMNLSPDMFSEFVAPFDQRILERFGGGAVHFCGRGDHYIDRMCAMDGVTAIAMSQPEYNDMEKIYRHTVDKGIRLIGFGRDEAERARAAGRDLAGCVHCG